MASQSQPVNVVLGASGPTGLECVKRLLAVSPDLPTRAVVRNPDKLSNVLPADSKLQIVKGDVSDPASLREALKGAKGVIFAAAASSYWAAPQVDNKGVANTAAVSKELGVERVVLVSSMLVTRQHWLNPIRILLNTIVWGIMDQKLKGEAALRSSGVDYTVVRPGGLTWGPGGQASLVAGQGDKMYPHSIHRADVAAVCVEALTNPAARHVTMEVVSAKGLPAGGFEPQIKAMWTGLVPDAS